MKRLALTAALAGSIALLGLGSLLFAVYAHHVARYGFLADDSFISFRYAQNLVEGHGLVVTLPARICEGMAADRQRGEPGLEEVVRGLDAPPILMGHSAGGVFVQVLLDHGLGAVGQRVLGEVQRRSAASKKSYHERYLDIYRLLKRRDRELVDTLAGFADAVVSDFDISDLFYRLVESCINLADADEAGRERSVALVKEWVDVAQRLDAGLIGLKLSVATRCPASRWPRRSDP